MARRTSPAGRFHRARLRRGQDDGFTIVETVITLLIMSIVVGLVLGFMTNLLQQSTNVRDTMAGVQQDQTAGEGLLQYLHAAIVILPGSNATTLDASILDGDPSGTPQTATFQAEYIAPGGAGLDATFQTSLAPNGGYCPVPPATPNPNCRSINDYDVCPLNMSGPPCSLPGSPVQTAVFSYYCAGTSTCTSTPTPEPCPAGFSCTTAPTPAELAEIVAMNIDVTFLAGPQRPIEGFQAVRPTSFETTVYLQNASGAPAPTSVVSVVATGTKAIGSPLTLTATVSPTPDGGYVTFSVTQNTSAYCTTAVDVSTTTGTAACTFTPPVGGTYEVSATFSGTFSGSSVFQAATSSQSAIVIPIQTTTTIGVTPASGQLSIAATVTAADGSTPTGSVLFDITGGSPCSSGCTSTVALNASGQASWTDTGLSNSRTYNVSATFSDSTGYYASSQATGGPYTP
jgi:type II secretory pathway pseudopilin PulG